MEIRGQRTGEEDVEKSETDGEGGKEGRTEGSEVRSETAVKPGRARGVISSIKLLLCLSFGHTQSL